MSFPLGDTSRDFFNVYFLGVRRVKSQNRHLAMIAGKGKDCIIGSISDNLRDNQFLAVYIWHELSAKLTAERKMPSNIVEPK